jgi:hypothetical protein
MIARLRKLGVNYVWGIINFTIGVTVGGIYVAAILVMHGAVR